MLILQYEEIVKGSHNLLIWMKLLYFLFVVIYVLVYVIIAVLTKYTSFFICLIFSYIVFNKLQKIAKSLDSFHVIIVIWSVGR